MACLCSYGWQESLGIMVSVMVGFRYVLKEKFSTLLCIMISKQLILLSNSFSMENVITGIALLKKSRHFSTSLLESLYTIRILSMYQK